ncbi:hypothetical protein Tco_1045016 [Tanacetum coccineum]|uniref:Uncharacterized protein n=1 Tax=Tanacetum coccineum TaxID=301880 RepID=A0ABQ5GRJ1_9ASTR
MCVCWRHSALRVHNPFVEVLLQQFLIRAFALETHLLLITFGIRALFEKNESHIMERVEIRETSKPGLVRRLLPSRGRIGASGRSISAMGRSITRYGFMIYECAVSWEAILQHMMTLLTTSAEYKPPLNGELKQDT